MEKLSSHSVDEVFRAYDKGKTKFAGASLKSSRITNFRLHGTKCVSCGLEGTHFIVEKHRNDVSPHLNLYHISANRYALMTRDHIRPSSKGGMNCVHNLQPMCESCNRRKSNVWDKKQKMQHFISFLKHRLNNKCNCSIVKVLKA